MGGSPSKIYEQSQYQFVQDFLHPSLGQIKLIRDKKNETYLAVKSFTFDSNSNSHSFLQSKLDFYRHLIHDNIIRCIRSELLNQSDFCSEFSKIYLMFEFFPYSLLSEIEYRANKNLSFSEGEILTVTNQLISVVKYLQLTQSKKKRLIISPNTIMISKEGIIKITDVEGLIGMSEYMKFLSGCEENCYLSPKLFESLGHRVIDPVSDEEKDNLWEIGLTLLDMIFNKASFHLYDFDDFKIKMQVLNEFFELIDNNFQFMGRIIRGMLEINEDNRFNCDRISNILQEINIEPFPLKIELGEKNRFEEQILKISDIPDENFKGFEENHLTNEEDNVIIANNYYKPDEKVLSLQIVDAESLNQIEDIELNEFINKISKLFKESCIISEEIQKKYYSVTNKIVPESYYKGEMSVTNKASIDSKKNNESFLNMSKINLYKPHSALYSGHFKESLSGIKEIPTNQAIDKKFIKNFEYNIKNLGTPKKAEHSYFSKKINTTPKRNNTQKSNFACKKYYTPDRSNCGKIIVEEKKSEKKSDKIRNLLPSYEELFWKELKEKYINN